MVIAVSWKNGGLSLWSVFGALLLCSLGDQPGTPSPLNPHFTILESLCWSSDGYHLWMLPIDASAQRRRWESLSEGGSQPSSARSSLSVDGDIGGRSDEDVMTTSRRGGSLGVCYGDGNKGCVLIMRFLKNSVVNNPVVSNHEHLFLQGSDRLYLNTSKSVVSKGNQGGIPSGNGMVSSPQWKVIQLPLSYLMLNWPVKYVVVNSAGSNIAIAGRAGFALYSGVRRKWKLFGNEIQEQSLVCRGGLLWFKDIIVFPCRVQEKLEEVRFYSLRSNLDNSQLLHTLKLTSPIIKLNLHGNHLVLGSRDCHMTIFSLNITVVPNKGLSLSVTKIHELSLANSISCPWATTLISMVPSSIRTESGVSRDLDRSVDSVLFNISGRLLMIQHELPRPYLDNQEDEWTFSSPVCLAQSVEAIWTPLHQPPGQKQLEEHLLESLWLACGATGIKVWLPLYPRDESHPSFLAKRIMLTLPIAVYPQAVLFQDAVLFGLSHETAFNETCFTTKQPFPYSTVERTAHIFLHHILRQLLRRNLGSHALQIARSCSHLPYFSHVLELMLHEILEEEAPGAMPVPDALLPRVVEFIKQFPEFLETVGSCARKTEVALWQYLFAAVGNPRDLFELCISDGRLKTATTYLIIIQNLEVSAVSRQLATRLLDASLDNNQWELCRDIVRFLRAIGPADAIESPAPSSLTATPATPHKTPLATPTPTTSVGAAPSLIAAPDLDRSAMSVTRDHLTSGSTSSVVSFSGEFKDAFGKVIRRPQFVMDVDSKEEYFIELILSRHARKLLTSGCLRDLGKFSAHLDFSLPSWLARERLRAARVDDFVGTLRELHKEFQWPFPTHTNNSTTTTTSRLQEELARDKTPPSSTHEEEATLSPLSVGTATPTNTFSPEPLDNSDSASVSSIKRTRRPPDLDLTPAVNIDLSPDTHQSVTVKNVTDSNTDLNSERPSQGDFDPTQSSTPTRTGSVSEKISLVLKQHPSSVDLQVENSSLGDIMEETDWDLGTEVTIATRGPHLKGSTQAEKEIRYFIDVTLESLCIEWTLVLGVLLLDSSVVSRIVDCVKRHSGVIDQAVIARILNGAEVFHNWAESECSGYTHYLEAIHPHLDELRSLLQSSPKVAATGTGPGTTTEDTDVFLSEELNSPLKETSSPRDGQEDPNDSLCTIS